MTTAVKAVYENGVFKPEEPVALADKAKVRLIIEESASEVVEARTKIPQVGGQPAS